MATVIISMILSVIISFTITAIGVINVMNKVSKLNDQHMKEYAENIKKAALDVISEHLEKQRTRM